MLFLFSRFIYALLNKLAINYLNIIEVNFSTFPAVEIKFKA